MANRQSDEGVALTSERAVYLDYQATTPTDPGVLQAMLPYFTEAFGNPHSVTHSYGRAAQAAVEAARARIAALIGAEAREIVFTSGATESNNLALLGVARFAAGRRNHVVTCVTEHKCVLAAAGQLEREGFRATYLPVQETGLVDLDRVAAAITPDTALVSIMAANNEIGVVQPLAEIGALCRDRGVHFHTDAAQAVGKMRLDVEAMCVDLMSISSHKMYGPKGIGALYVRRRPRVRLEPLIHGGGQERGLRSGTLPTPLCVGFGEACAMAGREIETEASRLTGLRDRLLGRILELLPDTMINGDLVHRIPGNLNVSFAGVDAEALMSALPEIAISSGSACSSAVLEPSYVLRALGREDRLAQGSVRIGLGRYTTVAEVDFAAERIVAAVERIRARREPPPSPLRPRDARSAP